MNHDLPIEMTGRSLEYIYVPIPRMVKALLSISFISLRKQATIFFEITNYIIFCKEDVFYY